MIAENGKFAITGYNDMFSIIKYIGLCCKYLLSFSFNLMHYVGL